MKRLTLLFDVDDTLLDFDAAESNSIYKVFDHYNLLGNDDIVSIYKKNNADCWVEYEKGLLTKEELGRERFERTFNRFGIKGIDADEIGLCYWGFLSKSAETIPGVHKFLESIVDDNDLYVITNGIGNVQKGRLELAKLEKYFKKRFVSETMKTRKPEKKYFDMIETEIGPFDRERTYIIGDSLTSDIKGGVNANIKTIWFNRKNTQNETDIKPDYEVKNYDELYNLLIELGR